MRTQRPGGKKEGRSMKPGWMEKRKRQEETGNLRWRTKGSEHGRETPGGRQKQRTKSKNKKRREERGQAGGGDVEGCSQGDRQLKERKMSNR